LSEGVMSGLSSEGRGGSMIVAPRRAGHRSSSGLDRPRPALEGPARVLTWPHGNRGAPDPDRAEAVAAGGIDDVVENAKKFQN